jgi:uroporphyrinogen-III decarboxylase
MGRTTISARQRFLDILNFRKPDDRLPIVEWAPWWDKTIDRWESEGLDTAGRDNDDIQDHFGLDLMVCIHAGPRSPECPEPSSHGAPRIRSEEEYENIRPYLFTDSIIEGVLSSARSLKERHDRGEVIIRLWLDGFFWFPRSMFGIENHLYAFYDNPELMHRMNQDLVDFNLRVIDALFPVLKPDMVGFAEDMSYNNGPMLSEEHFREFLTPCYRKVIPRIKDHGTKVLVDSDGDITSMIPWMENAGIEGVYPLERQAGVDLSLIRARHPDFLLLGGYDKMVMFQNEEAMRGEFERLLPVMRSGGYVPSVDHQTPPQVSLEQYQTYLRLFSEYARTAAKV